jgi:uncharacterized cupredoxin-like copper-binding protein
MRSRILVLFVSFVLAVVGAACSTGGPALQTVSIVMQDETVRFDVQNAGEIAHEFFVGTEIEQGDHETEMRDPMAAGHDHPTGVHVEAGKSKKLAIKFSTAGTFLMGCHEPGHYAAGMKGTIVVE